MSPLGTFSPGVFWPGGLLFRGLFSRGSFAGGTFGPGDICPGGLLSEGSFARVDFFPGVFCPEALLAGEIFFCPGGLCPFHARFPQF